MANLTFQGGARFWQGGVNASPPLPLLPPNEALILSSDITIIVISEGCMLLINLTHVCKVLVHIMCVCVCLLPL